MKRVLIVAYYYPPQPRAGSLRPAYLAAHLEQFGWEPTVITVAYGAPAQDGVVRVRQLLKTSRLAPAPAPAATNGRRRPRIVQMLRDAAKAVVYFPDDASSWYVPAITRALQVTRKQCFDAVISTAPPPTAHLVGHTISCVRRVPWLADYRDMWSGLPAPQFDRDLGEWQRRLAYPLERWLLKRAAAIVCPTPAHGEEVRRSFGRTAIVVPNACDLDAWKSVPDVRPAEFSLCFTGAIHPGLRTPDSVFGAAAALRAAGDAAGKHIRFDFFGNNGQLVADQAARWGISDAVRVHGEVEHRDALAAQRSSAVLLLLLDTENARDRIEVGNPGSKIYEYVGADRPVLAVGSERNVVRPLLEQYGIGVYAVSSVPAVMEALRSMYAAYAGGKIKPDLSAGFRPFTPAQLAGAFADVLDRMTAKAVA